ncbi:hypothetical protein PENTCL1PPCAC_25751, partial [Pristionchus entomophagus]
ITRYIGFDNEDNQKYVHDLFNAFDVFPTHLKYDLADIDEYIVVVFWHGGLWNGHWQEIIGSATLGILGQLAYVFMTYAAINTMQHLKNTPQMSQGWKQQHVQLFRALVLQALTPFITSYVPIGLCGFLPFFGAELPLFSVLTPPFCALHPVFDAVLLPTQIFFCRNTLIDWVLCRDDRKNSRVIFLFDSEEKIDVRDRRRKSY